MTSEEYLDAIAQVTGCWPKVEGMKVSVANEHMRAWRHKKPDTLALALGRPNREQVCTERCQDSTVLQSLELVNGSALAKRLDAGAKAILNSDMCHQKNSEQAVQVIYLRALGRLATPEEIDLARPLVDGSDSSSQQQGWEDFLWLVFVSPEFQFIH